MPKLGARLIRASFYSILLSALLGVVAYLASLAMNTLTGNNVVNTVGFTLFFSAIGFAAPLAVELSKDLEEEK